MARTDERFLWMNGWERFQTFQTKRGKLWTPPWIKVYLGLLDNPDYLDLSARRRSFLHGLWLVFGRCPAGGRLMLGDSVAKIGRMIADDTVRRRDIDSLNHAGWVDFCSRTVLEQRWDAFWNGSILEVEVRSREEKNPPVVPPLADALVVVLEPVSETAFLILAGIDKPGYHEPKFTRARFAPVVDKHLVADLIGECQKLADWETYGGGAGKPAEPKDGIARFRNWLAKVPTVPVEEPYVVGGGIYPPYDSRIHPHYPEHTDPFELPKRDDEEAA